MEGILEITKNKRVCLFKIVNAATSAPLDAAITINIAENNYKSFYPFLGSILASFVYILTTDPSITAIESIISEKFIIIVYTVST